MITPDNNTRISTVAINLPQQYFKLTIRNNTAVTHIVSKDSTRFGLDDKKSFTAKRLKIQSNERNQG
jgi:hypothetical protein